MYFLKGNWSMKYIFYIWKYLPWLKQKEMSFFDTCNAVAAREDDKPKYWRLGRAILDWVWSCDVIPSYATSWIWFPCSWFPCSYVCWSLVKARKIVWESQVIDSNSITQSEALWAVLRVWRCDVTTSNLIKDGGAVVVNILVFDVRVQLQHCTYQRKRLLFTLIKVSTFKC